MYKVLKDIQLTKNFKLSEFICKDGSNEVLLEDDLLQKLQVLRDELGKPVIVISAYRNEKYNKLVGGAPKSQHLYGKAADIKVPGVSPLQVAKIANKLGFNGIGVYTHNGNSFTHVDVRDYKSYWQDSSTRELVSLNI